ncbi:F-box/FBD/LRR-repeat protein At3g51530 [Capsella rubella]|uniref:F-box/FBD/LRR-repeat protein At3g51530 n=1 Tax=Capsella rubella TaxID=81985 RepID=UPI000CD5093F|nr:F-box/FBD/LRR-repeat protein At3g51530 [Capsella rubella]
MEQCLRIRVVMGLDRISEFPEELLLKILSFLPTKDVIATTVLSKRWRSLWKLVPKLEFESENEEDIAKFAEKVGRCLLSHKAPVLESLHLKVTDEHEETICGINVGLWVGIAVARHVRELVLDLSLFKNSLRFPTVALFCDTLEALKLKYSVLVDVPSPVYMKSLRTLHLDSVKFKDNDSIHNFISSCPNLEDLLIHRVTLKKVLIIEAPSLKRLSISGKIGGKEEAGGYVISARSLKYLNIRRLYNCRCCLIENARVLVKATVSNVSYIVNENILGSLKLARRLSLDLSPLEIKCPTRTRFYNLVYLEMSTIEAEWWNLLKLMLESSPQLQVLKLIDDASKDDEVSGQWSEPKYIPECLSCYLETFVWIRYDWEREEEKEVAKYILRNATFLKKATFSTRPVEHQKSLQMLNELNSVVSSASNSCHILFE